MKSINKITIIILVLFLGCKSSKIQETPLIRVNKFDLKNITLLDGPFKHATELNAKSLLNYEVDRLLAKFRSEAGLEPKAEHYHGWEDNTIAGHSLGHYLSACALMYRSTGEKVFLEKVNYIVDELEICQTAHGDGYLGAFPNGKKILKDEVSKGDIRSQGFDLNGIWVPYYNLHKTMAGLRDAYRLCNNNKALLVEQKLADWIERIVAPLNDGQIQKMLDCEHGGINEVLVDLYYDTGRKKYLDLSWKFHHKVILDSLANGKDILPGIHGNTQIPKLIGLARRYELTGNKQDYKAATFFWDRVVNHHSYVTGGHGNHEYFGQPDSLKNRLSSGTTETCNVYNMLKLSSHLFQWKPDAKIADYYERALFNQILSSQHPDDGRVIYNLSLEMGGHKIYQDPYWFTCCVGTGMENHSKYGNNIFYYNDHEIYISQFIAAELDWPEKDIKIRQITKFPEEESTVLKFDMKAPKKLTVKIRYPYWAKNGIIVKVNEKSVSFDAEPSSFIAINRIWENGDKIKVFFPFTLRLESMPDDRNRVAIMYGPLVMAGDLGAVQDSNSYDPNFVPVLITEKRDPDNWLNTTSGKNNFYLVDGIGNPRSFNLKPFYKTHDRRYSVYWDIFNQKEWLKHQREYTAEIEKQKKLEEMTYDFFQPGEMQQERDHNFKGEKVEIYELQNRKSRVANRKGWFSFDMRVMKGVSMTLVVEYWGGYTGDKTFDILVNDNKIATQNISSIKDGSFLNKYYDIPDALTVSENYITIKFMPQIGHRAGPIFSARTIKR